MDEKLKALSEWIRATLPTDKGVIIPVSGGTDSALTFWLYASVMPERTIGVHFKTSPLRSCEWFENVGTIRDVELSASFVNPDIARWGHALDLAIAEDRVLVGTRNRTEHVLGTYSMASRTAFHQPIAGVWKSDVLAFCEQIGVPDEVIASSRAADIDCGRPEDLAGIPFAAVDDFARERVGLLPDGEAALSDAQRIYLDGLYRRNAFRAPLPLIGPEV